MSNNNRKFGVSSAILGAAVANGGTFTVPYAAGYSQGNYLNGLAIAGAYMTVNYNDRYDTTKIAVSYDPAVITITNNTGAALPINSLINFYGPVAVGNDTEALNFSVDLATITGAQDVITSFKPGVGGIIEAIEFVMDKPVVTAAKAATLSPFINAAAVTGGAIALTSANATPKGKIISGAAITALNSFTPADTISIKATAVTAFVEGSGTLVVHIRKTYADQY